MTKPAEGAAKFPPANPELPPSETWCGPMAWVGSPPKPVADRFDSFPETAAFVRAQAQFTASEQIGPGMSRQTYLTAPALLRLEKGKPVEVHAPGPQGRCCTYRAEKSGKKKVWKCYAGNSFPALDPDLSSEDAGTFIERVVVQSLAPAAGSGKYISFAIHADGRFEDFARAVDPDPND